MFQDGNKVQVFPCFCFGIMQRLIGGKGYRLSSNKLRMYADAGHSCSKWKFGIKTFKYLKRFPLQASYVNDVNNDKSRLRFHLLVQICLHFSTVVHVEFVHQHSASWKCNYYAIKSCNLKKNLGFSL